MKVGAGEAGRRSYPGRLFVVEGVDGSGKSTQLTLLAQWLRSDGFPVVFSEWNSSPIVQATTRRGKRRRLLTPTTFSLIHATDFADRVEREIVPSLKAGAVVLADRYAYTAFARDVTRGVDPAWVRSLYRFAPTPTLAFYFRVPLDIALRRILSARPSLKWYEALVPEFGLTLMDAKLPAETQQRQLRQLVSAQLKGLRRPRIQNAQV